MTKMSFDKRRDTLAYILDMLHELALLAEQSGLTAIKVVLIQSVAIIKALDHRFIN